MPGKSKGKIVRGEPTVEALKEYCTEYRILVPVGASKAVYEAAITRAGLHLHDVRLTESTGCFGYWASDDTNCSFCSFEKECEYVSLGVGREKYERSFKKVTTPIEFSERLLKRPRNLKKS